MEFLRIVIFAISLIVGFITFVGIDGEEHAFRKRSNVVMAIITTLLATGYVVILLITNLTVMAIPKVMIILLGLSFLYCSMHENFKRNLTIGATITVIVTIITGLFYINNIEYRAEINTTVLMESESEITISSDGESYFYYYVEEGGGLKQGNLPVDNTTIYFVETGENCFIEKVVESSYFLDFNYSPEKKKNEFHNITYNLYVYEDGITYFTPTTQ